MLNVEGKTWGRILRRMQNVRRRQAPVEIMSPKLCNLFTLGRENSKHTCLFSGKTTREEKKKREGIQFSIVCIWNHLCNDSCLKSIRWVLIQESEFPIFFPPMKKSLARKRRSRQKKNRREVISSVFGRHDGNVS